MVKRTNQKVLNNIRDIRVMRGWTQEELAMRIGHGYTKQSISKWETGCYDIGIRRLMDIAAALDVCPEEVFTADRRTQRCREVGKIVRGGFLGVYVPLSDPLVGGELIPPPRCAKRSVMAVTVYGDFMQPVFYSGDMLFFESPSGISALTEQSQYSICKTLDRETYIAIARYDKTHQLYDLSFPGMPGLKKVQLEWAEPIRWHEPRIGEQA